MNHYRYNLLVNGKIIDLNTLNFPYDMTDYMNLTLFIGSFESRKALVDFLYDTYLIDDNNALDVKMVIYVKRKDKEFYKPISDVHSDRFLSKSTIKYLDINCVKDFYKANKNNKNLLESLGNFYLVENVRNLTNEEKGTNLNYLKHLKNENTRLNNYLKIVKSFGVEPSKVDDAIDMVIDAEIISSNKSKTVNMRKLSSLTKQMVISINSLVKSKRRFIGPYKVDTYDDKLRKLELSIETLIQEKAKKL